jgi:hypothetical protein
VTTLVPAIEGERLSPEGGTDLMFSLKKPVRFVGRNAKLLSVAAAIGVIALPGAAYASHELIFSSDIVDGQVFSVDVANGSLTGTDIRDGSITGSDVSEASLNFGSTGIGCKSGTVLGFARVKGDVAGFPNIYTTSSTYVDIRRNCSGGAISVRRVSTGVYMVRFAGNPASLALAQTNADGFSVESTMNDNIVTVAKVTDSDGQPSFRVEVQDVCGDCSNGTDPTNGRFTIMLP